jgi:hypothetical protein
VTIAPPADTMRAPALAELLEDGRGIATPGGHRRSRRFDLADRVTLGLGRHRDHVLEVVEAAGFQEDVLEDLALVEHEARLDVVLGHGEGELEHIVQATADDVAMVVLALERAAPGLNQIGLAEADLAVEECDGLGLVLEIGIDGADVSAAGVVERASPPGRNSAIRRMVHRHDVRMPGGDVLDLRRRSVDAAVVHEHDLSA